MCCGEADVTHNNNCTICLWGGLWLIYRHLVICCYTDSNIKIRTSWNESIWWSKRSLRKSLLLLWHMFGVDVPRLNIPLVTGVIETNTQSSRCFSVTCSTAETAVMLTTHCENAYVCIYSMCMCCWENIEGSLYSINWLWRGNETAVWCHNVICIITSIQQQLNWKYQGRRPAFSTTVMCEPQYELTALCFSNCSIM